MEEASHRSPPIRAGALVLAAVLWLGGCTSGESSSSGSSTRPDRDEVEGNADEPTLKLKDPTTSQEDTCEGVYEGRADPPSDFGVRGRELAGDVDGDERLDRVTLRANGDRPEACRRALVVETAMGVTMTALVEPLDWPSTDAKLLLLADIDRRAGVEAVVALSPAPAVFRPGAVFTVLDGDLAPVRLGGKDSGPSPRLFPFYDEFPSGVDCTGSPGEIVVTVSRLAPRGNDSEFGITRTFYHSDRATFRPVNREEFVIDCCNGEASRRWPETADDPFRSCPGRIH